MLCIRYPLKIKGLFYIRTPIVKFIVNLELFFFGLAMSFSGFLIQIKYHMGHHGGMDKNSSVLGLNYFSWTDIHKISVILFSLLMILHITGHWKWYTTVIRKKFFGKNRQVLTLSVIFLLVASTGYVPWLIHLTGGTGNIHEIFVEIHDKIAIILFVYLILHVIKRLKWYMTTFDKLRNKHSIEQQC